MVRTSKRKKELSSESDQRRWPRLKPSSVPFLKSVTFNQGSEVQVIDISRGGMLIETEVRLRPEMKIHLKLLTSDGLIKLDGSVIRSSVASLQGAPKYRTAIAFEHPFHMLDDMSEDPAAAAAPETQPQPGTTQEPEQGSAQPLSSSVMGKFDEDSSVMTFVALDVPGSALADIFKRNDW